MLVQQEGASVGIQMSADNAATIERNRTVAGHRVGSILWTGGRPSSILVLLLRHRVVAGSIKADGCKLRFETSRRLLRNTETDRRGIDNNRYRRLRHAPAVVTISHCRICPGKDRSRSSHCH